MMAKKKFLSSIANAAGRTLLLDFGPANGRNR
jgi:hypothetical protein